MREHFRNKALETIKEADAEIFITRRDEENDYFSAIGFTGKKNKSSFHYRYKTDEKMMDSIKRFTEERHSKMKRDDEWKAEKALKKAEMADKIKVGDILYRSWGYEQTNIDFYQVVSKTKSSVVVRELNQDSTQTQWMQGTTKAIKDSFIENSKEIRKMINGYGAGGFSLWDGSSLGWSSYH